MKKMMLMMAVVVLAMATNAATLTWSMTGLKAPVDSVLPGLDPTFSAVNLVGAVGYVFVGAQDTAALKAAIDGGKFTGAGNLWTATTSAAGGITKTTLGAFANQDVTLYSVVFNGPTIAASTMYMISSDYTQHFLLANLTYQFTTANGRMPGVWTTIVPEPTSMALLAIGVAALGLRRKNRK